MDRVDESEGSKAIALKAIRGVFIERDARVVQELFAPDYISTIRRFPMDVMPSPAFWARFRKDFATSREWSRQKAASS